MASINKVILLGNLTTDPEVKKFQDGQLVKFSLATNEREVTLKNGTVIPARACLHSIIINGKLSEIAEKWLHKGDLIYLEGKILTRTYDDETGKKRWITEIIVDSFEMIKTKRIEQSAPMPTNNPYQNDDDLPF